MTKIKKEKKLTSKQLQDLIWIECRRIIKERYPNVCYTCGAKNLVGRNMQTGHMIAKKFLHNYLKYDLRVLRPQCLVCNKYYGGMGALFITNMINIEGQKYVQGIIKDMALNLHGKEEYKFYQDTLEEYREILK